MKQLTKYNSITFRKHPFITGAVEIIVNHNHLWFKFSVPKVMIEEELDKVGGMIDERYHYHLNESENILAIDNE